jgi:hypothetical protein
MVIIQVGKNENICGSNRGAHKKERHDETQFTTKIIPKT